MKVYIALLLLFVTKSNAQELFVVTDPASNVPAGSLGIRLGQSIFKKQMESGYNYHMMPEATFGINKNVMVRTTLFVSNRYNQFDFEGGGLYAKYRFLSTDDVQSHFRMAVYGRYSFNNAEIHQEQLEIQGQNTGFETGLVATQLIKKVAISSSISFEKAFNNKPNHNFPDNLSDNAANYTLSIGKLMHPKKYTNFKQTNINAMVEFIGQTLNNNGRSFLDAVPSIQFIINSQARVDVAYRYELYNSMMRTAPNGFYLNVEYNFFNILK